MCIRDRHSRLFGRTAPDDAVISEDGAVTFLNQTARYAPVRPLTVLVREPDGSPAAGAEVTFGIVNASRIFPRKLGGVVDMLRRIGFVYLSRGGVCDVRAV